MAFWGPLIGAGASLLGGLFSNKKSNNNAASTAANLAQLQGIGKQYYDPFIQRGVGAQDQASAAYERMLQNPTSFVEQIMSSYKPSQGYDFRKRNAVDAARNSAASGGFSGTYNDQLQQAGIADNLLSQDMQQYLQNILGVHNTGLAGQQHVGDMGFQAAGSLADYIGNALGSQANLSHAQNAQKNSNMGGLLNGLTGLTGAALPAISSLFGGSGAPAGVGAGAQPTGPMTGMRGAAPMSNFGAGQAGVFGNSWNPSSRFTNASNLVNGRRGFSSGYGGIK